MKISNYTSDALNTNFGKIKKEKKLAEMLVKSTIENLPYLKLSKRKVL